MHGARVDYVHTLGVCADIQVITIKAKGMSVVIASSGSKRHIGKQLGGGIIITQTSVIAGYPKSALIVLTEFIDDIARDGVYVFAVSASDEVG